MELPKHIQYRYQLTVDVDLHLADAILSEGEKSYLDRISHNRRKREFIAGRITARQLAGEALACTPQDVPLIVKGDGSLELEETAFGVSLAHTQTGVCAAVAMKSDIGIDLETIKPRHKDLYKFIFHPEEYSLLDAVPMERTELLILSWTLKEATLKGMKTGFRCSPKKLRLSIDIENQSANIDAPGNVTWKAKFEKKDGCFLSIAYPE